MRLFLCSALFLPFVICSDSLAVSSPSEHEVQIQLHNMKTYTTSLKPLDLKTRDDKNGLLPYGFIINTKRVNSETIIVKNQIFDIPKNAKALLLTLSKHQGKEFSQDIQLTPFTLQPPEFKDVMLKTFHVPIYLQVAERAVQVEHGQEQEPGHHSEQEEQLSVNQDPAGDSEYKQGSLSKAVRLLFKEVGRPKWPLVALGKMNAATEKGGNVQLIKPLTQTSNKLLDAKYFTIPYSQENEITVIKIHHKVLYLTRRLKDSENDKNPHIIVELKIFRKESDESIIFPHHSTVHYRYATEEEIENIPEIEKNMCNIYFHFKILEESSSIDSQKVEVIEEDPEERSPKPRRRSCIGTSPWSKRSF